MRLSSPRLELRVYRTRERRTTTPLELFFDLVFVVAVARLGELLYHDRSVAEILTVAGLLATVWWAWISFSYFSDLFGDDTPLNRLVLLGAMLGACIIALVVEGGVGDDSAWMAGTFAALFAVLAAIYATARRTLCEYERFWSYFALGSAVSAVGWALSLVVPPPQRYVVWGVALAANMALSGPLAYRPRHPHPEQTSHMPERFASFTLIVLGESVLAVVVGLGSAAGSTGLVATAIAGFVIACGIWWVYFARFDGRVITRALEEQTGPANLWTFVYGYGHFVLYMSVLASGIALKVTLRDGVIIPLLGVATAGVVAGLLLIWVPVRRPARDVLAGALVLASGSVVVSTAGVGAVPATIAIAAGWIALAVLVSPRRDP